MLNRTRTRRCVNTKVGLQAMLLLVWLVGVLVAEPPHYAAARHGGPYMHNYYLPPAPSASPWMPCWSPDGKWIAVSFAGSIWKIEPNSGEAFELTAGPTYHSSPAWSPDGRWIVYTSDDNMRGIQLGIVDVADAPRPVTASAPYMRPFSKPGLPESTPSRGRRNPRRPSPVSALSHSTCPSTSLQPTP